MTDSSAPPDTAPETTEVVAYRVTALRPDGEPAVPWTLPGATVPSEHAERLRRTGYRNVRVESRTVRTWVSGWRPVDTGGDQ